MTEPLNNNLYASRDQNQHYDALIIGQGLAGSLLSWEMIQQNQRVLVLDNQHHGSSSKIAAGIINPITGHRINLTERFAELIHIAKNSYRQISDQLSLQTPLILETPQQRLIKNPGQKKYFEQRLQQKDYHQFLSSNYPHLSKTKALAHLFFNSAEYGVANILQTHRVDTLSLLENIKKWLQQQQAFIETKVDYDQISIHSDGILFNNHDLTFRAKHLIFCEGFQAIHNPWLQNLPFKLAKGEILTVELDKELPSMMNWGQWLLPSTDSGLTAKLGASYTWNDHSLSLDSNIARTLLDSLSKQSSIKANLLNHQAGVRPATINRKPLIGTHPKFSNVYCFNGFGSKGCLTIPHYAKTLATHFRQKIPLDILLPELDPHLSLTPDQS